MNTDINNSAFCYSVNMLRLLLKMQLITQEEYERILQSAPPTTAPKKYMSRVKTLNVCTGCIRTLVVSLVLP